MKFTRRNRAIAPNNQTLREVKMTNEEYDYLMEEKEARRISKLCKKGRHRGIKNFFIWLIGVLCGLILIVGTVCAGIFLVPLGSYADIAGKATGKESSELISEEMSKGSLYYVISHLGDFSFGDIPALGDEIEKAVTESEYRDIVKFDKQKFNSVKIGGVGKDGSTAELTSCVEVKASFKDLTKLFGFSLGAIGEMSSFKDYQPVDNADRPSATAEGESPSFNVHDFYYLKSEGVYARAFGDDGKYVEGVTSETALYYPAIMDVNILEIPNIYADAIARVKIKEIIKTLNPDFDENGSIGKIVKEKTIKEFTNISVDEILISDILDLTDKTDSMYKMIDMLCDTITPSEGEEKPTAETLSIGDFNKVNFTAVKLSKVIDLTDKTSEIYKMVDMLCDTITPSEGEQKPTAETLSIGDFNKVNFTAVKLCKILDGIDESTWKIIENGTEKSREEVTVSDLASLKTDNLKLIDVLKDETVSEKKIWTVLLDGMGKTEADKNSVKLSDLSSFNVDAIKLVSVLEKTAENERLWNILKDVTGSADENGITLGSLSSFDVDSIKLVSVLEKTTANEKLWTILTETTGKTDVSQIVLGDLNDFSTDNIKLVSVMGIDRAEDFWDIIIEGSGRIWTTETRDEKIDSLTLRDMSGFKINNVRLGTVISPTGNNVVDKLIEKNVMIGEVATEISNLTLYEAYGEQCFTEDSLNAKDTAVKFVKMTDASGNTVFSKDANGTYYLSKQSGMWLIICYQGNGTLNDDGKSTVFVARDFTIQQLQSDSGAIGEESLHSATMADLMESGIVPSVTLTARMAKMTFEQFIAEAVIRMATT